MTTTKRRYTQCKANL